MIHHSFHIDSFSTILELIYIQQFDNHGLLEVVLRFNFPQNLCSSLQQAQYSYKEEEVYVFPESTLVFLQRLQLTSISDQLFSEEDL